MECRPFMLRRVERRINSILNESKHLFTRNHEERKECILIYPSKLFKNVNTQKRKTVSLR
jgi:hypothetical protein